MNSKHSEEHHKVLKIFIGESDLSILELKKEVTNEKFQSVHVFTGNGKQSYLKAKLLLLKLIHLFAREVLLVKQLDIVETKNT